MSSRKKRSLFILLLLVLFYRVDSRSSSTKDAPTLSNNNNNVRTKTHVVSSTGDKQHADLDKIEVKCDKKVESVQQNQKHSNTSSGFSLKNPVSSFRSWVTQKKSAKEDSTRLNHSATTYGKIDTSPTPRKSSSDFENLKRTRTNSASASNAPSVIHNHHQDVPSNSSSPASTSLSPSSSAARVKKKSSFTLRHTNPIALLKRTAETNHPTVVNTSNNDSTGHSSGGGGAGGSGSAGGGGGAFGYLKSLVRGDSSSSERKQ